MDKIKRAGIIAGVILSSTIFLLILVNLFEFRYRCIFKMTTGIPCPTCGMTRAYLSLLRLDLQSAFYYHPLFWVVPPAAGLFLIKKGRFARPKFRIIAVILILAVFVLVYLLRLFVFSESLIYYKNILFY
jgi:hypothetical protein